MGEGARQLWWVGVECAGYSHSVEDAEAEIYITSN